jgi:hypothetical protein
MHNRLANRKNRLRDYDYDYNRLTNFLDLIDYNCVNRLGVNRY